MEEIYLGLGSNMGDRKKHINQTINKIEKQLGPCIQQSSLYRTAAWGKTNQSYFINQVIQIRAKKAPIDILDKMLEIEMELGRVRKEKWGERKIDIDLLFYGSEIVELPRLLVPHPFIAERRFVLVPMNEIAPNFIHPIFERSIADLLSDCPDTLPVELVD
ncbi:MAG: 2-amino-4-hydroxy-6-hydroxymethyldihydropteridine diphosphokinase [Saprospiraceae bacterium]|nr:2-amino-4-hydroxy-6-hydroxymethyldihydropteridine diphosphokinase [Saprospiraceae bacterium]